MEIKFLSGQDTGQVALAVQKSIIGDGGNIVKMYDKYEHRQFAEVFYRTMPVAFET